MTRKKDITPFQKFIRLLSYFKACSKWSLVILFTTSIAQIFFNISYIYLIKPLTDIVLAPKVQKPTSERMHMLGVIIIIYFILYLLENVIQFAYNYTREKIKLNIGLKVRRDIYSHLLNAPIIFFSERRSGEIYSEINQNSNLIMNFLSNDIQTMFKASLTIICMTFLCFSLSPKLTLYLLIPLPLAIILTKQIAKYYKIFTRSDNRKLANISSIMYRSITAMMVIKTHCTEKLELKKFDDVTHKQAELKLKHTKFVIFFIALSGFIGFSSTILVRWFGSADIINGSLTLGQFMILFSYLSQITSPWLQLDRSYAYYKETSVASEAVFQLLDGKPDVSEEPNKIAPPPLQGSIRFDNVSFSYENKKDLLRGVSFTIKPGQIVGIAGPSGSGKTTLTYLLYRLYNIKNGSINIDGYDIRDIKVRALRQQIGIVLQDTLLFYGTIAENIAYAKPKATMDEIVKAAKIANIHGFIMRLPEAYDTFIGERGLDLSGGERQRLSIARVLLMNPPIIIFDEATSAMDIETEAYIKHTIEKLAGSHTIIIISHRLSMFKKTDNLFILDKGKILEVGSYENFEKINFNLHQFEIEDFNA